MASCDPLAVHGLRVACARLEVYLRLAHWNVLRGDLRWLRRAASGVRDLDVLLADERAGQSAPEFVATLRTARESERAGFANVLEHERCRALLEALDALPEFSAQTARAPLELLTDRVRSRGELMLRSPDDFERFHALRRALRRLRYAREWLGLDCTAIRALQDELGALNDAVVRARWLARAGGAQSSATSPSGAEHSPQVQSLGAAALRVWRRTRREILEIPA